VCDATALPEPALISTALMCVPGHVGRA
jgi:hypothetical protein